jgi:hypothetical protein
MSQHDYNIANGGGAAVRADINNALLAILSQNSGATAPTTTKPFMTWYDTTTGILKIRNAADNAWVTFASGAIADASIAQAKLAANVAGNGPAFSAYSTTGQSFSNGTSTKIQFQNEEFDTASCFDNATNYRFTPNVAGYYQVNVCWGTSSTLSSVIIALFKNGSDFKRGSSGTLGTAAMSALVYMNGTTDYVEGYVYNFSGSTVTNAGTQGNFFQSSLVRAA